ncbi:MAG: SUMF1/EgtB/PvdO family nonheme iron enzyme [Saprospiraceae bacterium]|nr:SUMF1/EgtB/PvdO family nonheme iron enzyme [Saprospiraceae bacterium]
MNKRKLPKWTLWGLFFSCLSISLSSQDLSDPPASNRALIFAVNDYTQLDTLQYSIAKASQLASLLQRHYNFQVEVVANPTADEIDNKLKEYKFFYKFDEGKSFNKEGQLLVYFIGQAHRIEGRSLFFPKDVSIRKMVKTAIGLPQLSRLVDEIECEHILMGIEGFLGTKEDIAAIRQDSSCLLAIEMAAQLEDSLGIMSKLSGNTRRFIGLAKDGFYDTDEADLSKLLYQTLEQTTDSSTLHLPILLQRMIKENPDIYCDGFGKSDGNGDFVFHRQTKFQYEGIELPEDQTAERSPLVTSPISRTQQDSQMIFVDGSTFWKGDEFKVGEADESPLHLVEVGSFLISGYEVTQEEYQAYCMARGIERQFAEASRRLPVNDVSWYDAIEYCNWLSLQHGFSPAYSIDKRRKDIRNSNLQDKLKWKISIHAKANGYRLPTESEWEFAAKSRGKHHIWTGTREPKEVAQFANYRLAELPPDSLINVAPVGSLSSNGLGLFDMSGNVAEWCWDWYDEHYYSRWTNENVLLTSDFGPKRGKFRVAKGGAWKDPIQQIRVSNRIPLRPDSRFETIGFRLVRSAE